MKLPIIINESGDITLYDSIADAETNLEIVDVKEKIYSGYDAEGRLLGIGLADDKVNIGLAESAPSHKQELEKLLRQTLTIIGKRCDMIASGDLAKLIEESKIFIFRPPASNVEIIKTFFKDLFKVKRKPSAS